MSESKLRSQAFPNRRAFCLAIAVLSATGCAGYRMGVRSMYRQDIRTVHVPIIRSDSFRPDLGVRLTEAVCKEIEDRTPYKIADASNSDSTLNCRITFDSKRVVTETTDDDPRDLRVTMVAEVNWTDRIGNVLMENRFLPPPARQRFFSPSELILYLKQDSRW